ncbi:MAG: dihydroorotate dehydrogenase electron transfer subunit [Oscillospiraceae bacterium]|nr:dihydroorotate dehydrogenase electron transfer subunit [Oscillospiraceae bacterium]
MKKSIFEIIENRSIAKDVCLMRLTGDTSAITAPGQFVNIELEGFYLRRPISVCDWEYGVLTIIYKVVGKGTEKMSAMTAGEKLELLTGLGNGYDMTLSGERPLLVGGGAGVPPMYGLCRRLTAQGKRPTVILGFNTAADVFFAEEFKALGANVIVTTVDGGVGVKGFVTDAMKELEYSYFYSCGPEPMLKALYNASATEGQLSFEERMGCGFGACMGCTCKTKYGNKRICKDGPVLKKEEVVW